MDQTNQTQTTKRIPAITAEVLMDENKKPSGVTFSAPSIHESQTVYLHELASDIRMACAAHGLKQKVQDAAAISRNPETGRSATVADKWAAMEKVVIRLLSGEWNAEREGGGATSYLFRAMCELKPEASPEKIKAWLDKKTTAEKAAMELNDQVRPIIERLRAAKAPADYDSDAAIAELDNME
jgi:hypothetical protein